MTEKQPGIVSRAVGFALDVANGRHALSRLIPLALFGLDAVLCVLIIWKIPCKKTNPPAHPPARAVRPPPWQAMR